ncbi:HAD hydrolase family protein [Enterococcus sp. AZ109]|uniref:HAD hydrolase family protein n=1 Tax=Enterococcus sp. AZ109 TaxID=2774634 RepID=UPI003F221D9C
MMAHLGAPLEDVVVFGDDSNDLVMFKEEWFTIAMGNATDELKNKASYVTDTNIDKGIYKACKHFGWFNDSVAGNTN